MRTIGSRNRYLQSATLAITLCTALSAGAAEPPSSYYIERESALWESSPAGHEIGNEAFEEFHVISGVSARLAAEQIVALKERLGFDMFADNSPNGENSAGKPPKTTREQETARRL